MTARTLETELRTAELTLTIDIGSRQGNRGSSRHWPRLDFVGRSGGTTRAETMFSTEGG